MAEITMTRRLAYLRKWFTQHGSSIYDDADDWINSMTNVELLEALCWCEPEEPAAPRPAETATYYAKAVPEDHALYKFEP